MAKKKDDKPKTWDQIKEEVPQLDGVIFKGSWDLLQGLNVYTMAKLDDEWIANMKGNVENKLWKKCGSLRNGLYGLGKDKGIIGIGSGSSFNLNSEVLKKIVNIDGIQEWEHRDFITVAANHQYKPLLNMGIIPDFVVWVDHMDTPAIRDQLLTDIPKSGQNTILIACMHCAPAICKEWVDQGRELRFFCSNTRKQKDAFHDLTKKNPEHHTLIGGGNVLNTAWMLSGAVFGSRIFFCVGNDLSYPLKDKMDDQRSSYYSDGNYSSNAGKTGSGRDEASYEKIWGGFTLARKKLVIPGTNDRYDIRLDLVGTSPTLWNYKTWIESMVIHQASCPETSFHYFNCSEGGILGVMARDPSDEALRRADNWFMLDQVCRSWHTAMLKDAIEHYLIAKEMVKCEKQKNQFVVPSAGHSGLLH